MRLLVVISSLSCGGAERVTTMLANQWLEKGWDVTIVTLAQQSEDFYPLHSGVKRIELKLAGNSTNVLAALAQNIRRILALRRVLRQVDPEVALAMMSGANILLAFASLGLSKLRTVGSERTYPPRYPLGRIWEWLRRRTYSRLDVVVAQTNEGAVWLKSNTSSKRVEAIPNPIGWPLANQLPQIYVNDICSEGRKILLAVGRLSGEKQFGLLLKIFHVLADRHPDWDLVILGEGELRPELESQVRKFGLEERIFLPGRAGNVGDWYERASLYVLCSRFEGFPNTLVEAMAYGLPAVSFDCDTGPRDIIRQNIDGILVHGSASEELSAKLDELMSDENLRKQLAIRAIEVRERFSIERISRMWESIFGEIVNDVTCR